MRQLFIHCCARCCFVECCDAANDAAGCEDFAPAGAEIDCLAEKLIEFSPALCMRAIQEKQPVQRMWFEAA